MNAMDLIKKYEGFKLEAYQCPAGIWTIGYGHTSGVKPGDKITARQAEMYLKVDIVEFEYAISALVSVPLTDKMRAALVSFVFNVGKGAFAKSKLLKKLNAGDYSGAANEFLAWNIANGKRLKGLLRRRVEERYIFLSPD